MQGPLHCPKCGHLLEADRCPRCGCAERAVFRLVQREIVLLVLLSAAAVAMFLFTRAVAAANRSMNARVAATWYERGRQRLQAGDSQAAADLFRRATINNREQPKYQLALADALAAGNYDEEARQVLLRLRDSSPEDGNINLQLARLAAKRGAGSDAVLYYHHALYGRWVSAQAVTQRREVRLELARFLLSRQQNSSAVSELLMLSADLPQDPAFQTQTAQLFLDAGEPAQALSLFTRAIRLDKKSDEAFAGAGEASFQLADYVHARRYLAAALQQNPGSQQVRHLLSVTEMVLSYDPLAPHLKTEERNRRLIAGFNQALLRIRDCLGLQAQRPESAQAAFQELYGEAQALRPGLRPRNLTRDPELLRSGVELIYRIEEAAGKGCGEPSELDRALLLIGRKRAGAEQ